MMLRRPVLALAAAAAALAGWGSLGFLTDERPNSTQQDAIAGVPSEGTIDVEVSGTFRGDPVDGARTVVFHADPECGYISLEYPPPLPCRAGS